MGRESRVAPINQGGRKQKTARTKRQTTKKYTHRELANIAAEESSSNLPITLSLASHSLSRLNIILKELVSKLEVRFATVHPAADALVIAPGSLDRFHVGAKLTMCFHSQRSDTFLAHIPP